MIRSSLRRTVFVGEGEVARSATKSSLLCGEVESALMAISLAYWFIQFSG
jgi:hypothetical protein